MMRLARLPYGFPRSSSIPYKPAQRYVRIQLLVYRRIDISLVQSDSTREKTLELHIQNRVQQELRRIEAHESQLLKELEDKICSESSVTDRGGLQGGDGQAAGDKVRDLSRDSIQKEITSLKRRLDSRKKLENLDRDVEKAKSNVVDCLRTNDRRPLDCWKEVQVFRQEVGRLEQSFVDKALR